MRVWIDLANSPHPLLFAPVARRLEELGHKVLITARDNAQTLPLARRRWPDAAVFGGPTPAGRPAKAWAVAARIADLRRWARRVEPDVALSHNSYAQIVAARSLRLPTVTAMDYEHQPANHLAFRLASLVLLPEVLPLELVRRQGAAPSKTHRYPGLKEDLYLGDFEPDPTITRKLGFDHSNGHVLVVTRTPPTRALYHERSHSFYVELLRRLTAQPEVRCVILTRHPDERNALKAAGCDRCVIPSQPLDSRSLMYQADIVIGAGGTMTREAALLGVPTYSVFAGRESAVDRWLEEEGRLRRLTRLEDMPEVRRRTAEPVSVGELRKRGRVAVEWFVRPLETQARGR